MARVTLEHVGITYYSTENGTQTALKDIDLEIPDGETLAIVGPSGCGKSTLLKVIAGLETPTTGRVLYNGHDVTQVETQQRGVGMVFQDYALYPTLKGKGNLSYFFEVNQRSEAEMDQHIREVSELMGVGFDVLLGQLPTTLSGGEKQRVAIARCIVRHPPVFLMDEPICNLDAKLRERTRIEMRRMLQKYKVTTVYVTHDQQEAIFMGDKIAVMRRGVLEQVGTFDDLYYTPANRFVAEFIGTPPMVFIPVSKRGSKLHCTEIPTAAWMLPDDLSAKLPDGSLTLGMRAEGWTLADDGAGIPMVVNYVERIPTQQAAFVNGSLGSARVSVLTALDRPTSAGQTVYITPDWNAIYFFEAAGENILHTPALPEPLF
jgi:ABC-type sugar transport system ATPase subunit